MLPLATKTHKQRVGESVNRHSPVDSLICCRSVQRICSPPHFLVGRFFEPLFPTVPHVVASDGFRIGGPAIRPGHLTDPVEREDEVLGSFLETGFSVFAGVGGISSYHFFRDPLAVLGTGRVGDVGRFDDLSSGIRWRGVPQYTYGQENHHKNDRGDAVTEHETPTFCVVCGFFVWHHALGY